MRIFTSVITSTHNKSKYLELTLAGLAKQTDTNFELVVVNDGSTDNTEAIIDSYKHQINIIYDYQNNTGISRARNKALELASGDNIIIIDDDRIPSPEFVGAHKQRLEAAGKIVSIGKQYKVISFYSRLLQLDYVQWMGLFKKYPQLVNMMDEVQLFSAENILNDPLDALEKHTIGLYDPALLTPIIKKFGEDMTGFHFGWSKAFGGNLAFNRNHAGKGVYYDENYRGYGKEDTDLSYQLYEKGYTFVFTKHAVNYHQEHPRSSLEYVQHYTNFNRFHDKYDSLESFINKIEHEGEISQLEANSFMCIIQKYHSIIVPKILTYIDKLNIE